MALVVVDTNLISMLVKLKHGRLKKDEERARRYEAFLQGQDMIRAFPTEAELHVWLQKLPEDDRKTQYATGIQEVLDQTGLIDGTDAVAHQWARIVAAGEKAAVLHVGHAGQSIYINRKENLVIVILGAWPQAPYLVKNDDHDRGGARRAFQMAVVNALH